MSLKRFWDDQADAWERFARTPGHDVFHEEFNLPAAIPGSYFEPEATLWEHDHDGIKMTLWDRGVPVERLSRALEAAGLLWEVIHEPVPREGFVNNRPLAARRLRILLLLHLRALKP